MKCRIYILLLFGWLFSTTALAQHNHVLVYLGLAKKENRSERDINQLKDSHNRWVNQLQKTEKIEFHGILKDGNQVLLFTGDSLFKVMKVLEEHSLISEGFFKPEVFQTKIRYGQFCDPAAEKLVRYNFVRYTSHITKYNIQQVPQLLKIHDDYLKKINETGNVAAEGVFSNSDGGFILIKGDLGKEVILNDPTYQAGFTIPEITDVYIQEGTFCEMKSGQ